MKSDELTFARAIQIAMETEDAARVAKETVFGTKPELLRKVGQSRKLPAKATSKEAEKHEIPVCYRCGEKVTFPMIVGSRMQSAIFVSEKVICSRSAERKSSLS